MFGVCREEAAVETEIFRDIQAARDRLLEGQ
jgi:hypothetical protein